MKLWLQRQKQMQVLNFQQIWTEEEVMMHQVFSSWFCADHGDNNEDPMPQSIPHPSSMRWVKWDVSTRSGTAFHETKKTCLLEGYQPCNIKPATLFQQKLPPPFHTILGYSTHFLPVSYLENNTVLSERSDFFHFLAMILLWQQHKWMQDGQHSDRTHLWCHDADGKTSSSISNLLANPFLHETPIPWGIVPDTSIQWAHTVILRQQRLINESSTTWISTNQYACSCWILDLVSPISWANKYHAVCCALSGIKFSIDEGNSLSQGNFVFSKV